MTKMDCAVKFSSFGERGKRERERGVGRAGEGEEVGGDLGEGESVTGTSTNISARTVNNFYQLSLEFMLNSLPAWQCTRGTWKSMYSTPSEDASPQIALLLFSPQGTPLW